MAEKSRKIVESFNCAVEGIIIAIKNEKHMRVHVVITIIIIIVCLFLKLTKLELALLAIAISLVLITEILNTAIEAIVDMYIQEYHELAKIAKDTAAGAVFIAAVNAVIIGYVVLYNHFELFSKAVIYKVKASPVHVSFISMVLVIVLVVGTKALTRKGTPFQGGMPSGHAAVAFSAWAGMVSITDNIFIILLGLFMALLVAQTRVKAGIHSFREVAVGALLGTCVTFLVFYIFQHLS